MEDRRWKMPDGANPPSSILHSPSSILGSPLSPGQRRLLHRIHRHYQTITEVIEVGPLRIPFTRIADPNRVLDEVAAEEDRLEKVSGQRANEDQLHLPYWAELWDSAMGVGRYLVGSGQWAVGGGREDRRQKTEDRRNTEEDQDLLPSDRPLPTVLDLGCGMGLSGTVAAALGHRVLFADLEAPALLFARLNALPYGSRIRTRRLNWQTDRLDERFELILGADILYERKQWPFLDPFWQAHLAAGGRVLLGEPGRQTGDAFINWIVSRGWKLLPHEQPVPTRSKPIRVLELWR